MDRKMMIAAIAIVAIVAVAACVLVLYKPDSYPNVSDVKMEEEFEGYFFITDGSGKNMVPLEKGAATYADTKITTRNIDWSVIPFSIDHKKLTVIGVCYMKQQYEVIMQFTNVKDLDASLVNGNMVISLTGIKKGFTVSVDKSDVPLPSADEYIGEWDLVSARAGSYDDSNHPVVRDINLTGKAVITSIVGSPFYNLSFNGNDSICAYENGRMVTSSVGGFSSVAMMFMAGDSMVISHVEEDYGAITLQFKKVGSNPSPRLGSSYLPDKGVMMNAFAASMTSGGVNTDKLDSNYRFTLLDDQEGFFFYKSEFNDGTSDIPIYYSAVEVGPYSYLACGYLNGQYLTDMVFLIDGVVYCTSFNEIGQDDFTLWSVNYGIKANAYEFDNDILDKVYEGKEYSFMTKSNGDVEALGMVGVTLTVKNQFNNLFVMNTVTSNGDPATWAGIVFEESDCYRVSLETNADFNDVQYLGYYICEFSKNLKNLTVIGALTGDDGSSVTFMQTYSLKE